jgi:hypothetical protein
MYSGAGDEQLRNLPSLIVLSTALQLAAGVAAGAAWWWTGDPIWIRSFFLYPGAIFLVACSLAGSWLSFQCWQHFSPGDLCGLHGC